MCSYATRLWDHSPETVFPDDESSREAARRHAGFEKRHLERSLESASAAHTRHTPTCLLQTPTCLERAGAGLGDAEDAGDGERDGCELDQAESLAEEDEAKNRRPRLLGGGTACVEKAPLASTERALSRELCGCRHRRAVTKSDAALRRTREDDRGRVSELEPAQKSLFHSGTSLRPRRPTHERVSRQKERTRRRVSKPASREGSRERRSDSRHTRREIPLSLVEKSADSRRDSTTCSCFLRSPVARPRCVEWETPTTVSICNSVGV